MLRGHPDVAGKKFHGRKIFITTPGVIVTTSSAMKCCDGNCVRRWPLTSFAIRTHLYLYDKGKGVCVRDVCAIYDNNISPSLLMIIIKIIILYFIQIRHTDAFPPNGYPASSNINWNRLQKNLHDLCRQRRS